MVTLSGSNLSGATKVMFGESKATITSDSDSQITVTTPAGAVGTVKVKVSTAGGTSTTAPWDEFTYVAAPNVTKVSPKTGPSAGGTSVSISGTNLAGTTEVAFGSNAGTITADSATSISVTSPAGAAGKVNVTVTTPVESRQPSAKAKFTYTTTSPNPTVTSVSPSSGPTAGGTSVSISGTNLAGASEVAFGSTAGTITANSATSITVTSPAESAVTIDVRVTTSAGTSATSSADKFTYANAGTFKPCKTLNANTTVPAGVYLIKCTEDVPKKITLTLDPGVIFKFGSDDQITVEGTLDAVGTTSNPITFTSINDNSVGGDTGSGTPGPGNWRGISGTGTLDLSYVVAEYTDTAVLDFFALTVTNSAIENVNQGLIGSIGGGGPVVVDNNTFSNVPDGALEIGSTSTVQVTNNQASGVTPGTAAYDVNTPELNFATLTDNSANSGSYFGVSGTVATNSTMQDETLPWSIDNEFDVPSDVTLTIAPGTVVKGQGPGSGCTNCNGITVKGTLDAVGTTSNPITFTSINDNSVGGDTGSGTPGPGNWRGISGTGTLDLSYVVAEYADTAVLDFFALTVTNSAIENVNQGLIGSIGGGGPVVVDNNTFSNVPDGALEIGSTSTVQVTNNQASGVTPGTAAYDVNTPELNFATLTDNSANSGSYFGVSGTVATNSTMQDETLPWSIDNEFDVPSDVTLTIAPGTVVKGQGPGSGCTNCNGITVEGTLDAVGTTSNPITFTSINDNSVGGDTGSGTPGPGNWRGISGTGTLDLSYVVAGVRGHCRARLLCVDGHQLSDRKRQSGA